MEPVPYFYDSINRNAIIIKPKKPYFEWINSIYQDRKPVYSHSEDNIYLIREMDSNDEIIKWLSRNFDKIFINELNDWCTDEMSWPGKRTFKMFKEWFDFEICSMLLDLEKTPVQKD